MMTDFNVSGAGMTSQRTRDRLIERLRTQGIVNESVLDAMATIPRHLFIDEAFAHRAYEDKALPIGFGQTISQPFTVALMSSALFAEGKLDRVLEIGTGCGYQTAILSNLAGRVFTVERIKALQGRARERLKRLGVRNVQFRFGDGGVGWPDLAPYDGVIVTASPREIPVELLQQMAPSGRMVIPVGTEDDQRLKLVTMVDDKPVISELERVKFVPMLRGKS